ncbi:MAG: hypothetical protein EOO05_03620 [Chitinophagaceae bacterium]|nr:MAG: hypothetical protein EOO05_03620 [Chitinophagaceae bacterium]
MQIHFTKVVHFTRLIKAGGRLREFNFRKLKQLDEDIFSVDTVDDRGNRILFHMYKTGNTGWSINHPQPLPAWITENEDKLREQIDMELQNPTS